LERRQRPFLLVRRTGGGDEQHLVQARLLPALLRQDLMSQMNGIERAAEDAQTHVRNLATYSSCGRAGWLGWHGWHGWHACHPPTCGAYIVRRAYAGPLASHQNSRPKSNMSEMVRPT